MLHGGDLFFWCLVDFALLLMDLEMEIVGTVNGGSHVVKLGDE